MKSPSQIAHAIKRRLFPLPPWPAGDIAAMFSGRPAALVKIGAHDGVQNDPTRELIVQNPQWTVLFVEPVKSLYQRLLENYPAGGRYSFENVAIAESAGTKPFYYVSDKITTARRKAPWWYDQLGSFDRNHIVKHGRRFEPFIVTEDIRCDTLKAVLERNGLTGGVDLIHIDTEGFDYEVLKQIDFSAPRLRAVLYENQHLNAADKAAAELLVHTAGFKIKQFGIDTLATRATD